jgi:uncharacterized membrane protein YkvA (DUF1232 family)
MTSSLKLWGGATTPASRVLPANLADRRWKRHFSEGKPSPAGGPDGEGMVANSKDERFTKAEIEAMREAARDEAGVLGGFWQRFRSVGRKLPFAEELVAAWVCATDDNTPSRVRFVLVAAIAYFIMPFDGIPDILPLMGFTDDAAVLATAIATVGAHMTNAHREKACELLGITKARDV